MAAPETKSITFRIRMTRMPQFTVTYKDIDDLFEAFKKKVAELGVPLDKVFWIDLEGEPTRMNNADVVLEAAQSSYCAQKLHVIDDADEEELSSCDEFADHRRGCCWTDHNPGGHHHPSDRSTGHRRLSGRPPHHHHQHQNPVPACVPCSCSLCCRPMGTGCCRGCSHGC